MRFKLWVVAAAFIILMLSPGLLAQVTYPQIIYTTTSPAGNACGQTLIVLFMPSGAIYTCVSGVLTATGSSITTPVSVANGGTNTASPSYAAQTDAATVTWAIGGALIANASLLFTAHSGSRALNVTGLVNGGSYVIKITQDATGGEGLTLGTGCTWKVSGGGAGAVTPSTGANAIDVLAFSYDGANCLANFNKLFN